MKEKPKFTIVVSAYNIEKYVIVLGCTCCNYRIEGAFEKDNYEETLKMVRAYNPLLIILGSEYGVKIRSIL